MESLDRLIQRLTEPAPAVHQSDERRQARLLSSLLLVLMLTAWAFVLAVLILKYPHLSQFEIEALILTLVATGLLAIIYALSRTQHYQLGVWLAVTVIALAVFTTVFFIGQVDRLDNLIYLTLALLLAGHFLSFRSMAILNLVLLAAVVILTIFTPEVGWVHLSEGPLPFLLLSFGAIHLLTRHRNLVEQDRLHQLAQSERRYRALFEFANDAIFLIDLDGFTIAANHKAGHLLGFSNHELIGKNIKDLLTPLEQASLTALLERLRAGEHVPLHEGLLHAKDGAQLPAQVNLTLIRDAHDTPLMLQCVIRDIRPHKRAQAEIKRQLKRLNSLREIDLAITASLDLRLTLDVLLGTVISQLEVDAANISLLNPYTKKFEHAANKGFRNPRIQAPSIHLGQGLIGQAALKKELVVRPDLTTETVDLPFGNLIDAEGFKAFFCVPLVAKGQVKGILQVFHRQTLITDEDWLNFLRTLAGQAAIAIENSQLFESLQQTNITLISAYDATLEGWAKALELRCHQTESRTRRVTELAIRLARAAGLKDHELVHLRRGILLHDIGNMAISEDILHKPGQLDDQEWEIMRQHPEIAYNMLSSIEFLRPALDIPHYHHEKWDGSGYPRGLKTEQIPLSARIFAIVDVYDSLCAQRPYRQAWPEGHARQYIREQAGTHFDPQLVEAFLNLLDSGELDDLSTFPLPGDKAI